MPNVSIVMLSMDRVDFTKLAISSLESSTPRHEYELIIVDNNSNLQTINWLIDQNKKGKIDTIIRNKVNLGFVKASNQGIKVSTGDIVVLVNNDVIFTPNWLGKLIKPFEKNSKVGMTTPTRFDGCTDQTINRLISKNINMPKPEPYVDRKIGHINMAVLYNNDLETLNNEMVYPTEDYVAFYCVAIPRKVIDKIGLLDERFGLGFAEDNDYCMRLKKAGYSILVCLDTFVFHYGMITFSSIYETNEDMDKAIRDNIKIFEKKWNLK